MANYDFSDIDKWALKTEARMRAVVQTAAQNLVEQAQLARAKGGSMPVDTGFLRNSGQAAINSIPSGGSDPNNMTATDLVLNRLQIGDRFVFGWTAGYAVYMEAKYAFMRKAAQNWPQIVGEAVIKVSRGQT